MATIMIVDDEMPILTVLRVLVGSMGHDAVTFQDPAEALRHVDSDAPIDLVLCDLRMTEVSGLDVLRTVREKRPTVPVIMVSAYLTDAHWQEARKLGASDGLSKPFQAKDLQTKIEASLAARNAVTES